MAPFISCFHLTCCPVVDVPVIAWLIYYSVILLELDFCHGVQILLGKQAETKQTIMNKTIKLLLFYRIIGMTSFMPRACSLTWARCSSQACLFCGSHIRVSSSWCRWARPSSPPTVAGGLQSFLAQVHHHGNLVQTLHLTLMGVGKPDIRHQ